MIEARLTQKNSLIKVFFSRKACYMFLKESGVCLCVCVCVCVCVCWGWGCRGGGPVEERSRPHVVWLPSRYSLSKFV